MAGTLEITEDLCWMPAGWIYDNVLSVLAEEVSSCSSFLATLLRDSLTTANGGYLDLRNHDEATLVLISQALDRAIARFESEAARSFYDPSAYPGFMRHVLELRDMLHAKMNQRLT